MRVTLDRDGPLYKVIYCRRTSAERINSQAKETSCALLPTPSSRSKGRSGCLPGGTCAASPPI